MRNYTLDAMKGFAILCVVWGHVVFESLGTQGSIHNVSYNIVSSFEMPVFFVVSGYLLYKTLPKIEKHYDWIKNKAIFLLIPHYIVDVLVYLIPLWVSFLRLAVPNYTFPVWLAQAMFLNQGEWFLWTLFIILVLLSYVATNRKFWLCLGATVFITLLPTRNFPDLFGIKDVQYYLPFTIVGLLIARYSFKKYWIIIFCALAYVPVMIWMRWQGGWVYNPLTSITQGIGQEFTRVLEAICGTSVVFCLGYLLRRTFVMKWLGQNSLGIYITSFLFIGLGIGHGILHALVGFVIVLCISISLTLLFSRVKKLNRWFPQGAKI